MHRENTGRLTVVREYLAKEKQKTDNSMECICLGKASMANNIILNYSYAFTEIMSVNPTKITMKSLQRMEIFA